MRGSGSQAVTNGIPASGRGDRRRSGSGEERCGERLVGGISEVRTQNSLFSTCYSHGGIHYIKVINSDEKSYLYVTMKSYVYKL